MTEKSESNSGTTQEQSTASSTGSETRSINLSDLLRKNFNGKATEEVSETSRLVRGDDSAALPGGDSDADLSELQEKDGSTPTGDLAGLDAGTRAEIEAILNQDAAENEEGDQGRGKATAPDNRERPPGVGKSQRTVKMLAEDLDIDPGELYKNLMVPTGDGTGQHMSLERLRLAAMGTDADLVAKERLEHDQRIAAFEVDKSEHETRTVRDRHEISTMYKLLADKLPPAEVQRARVVAQRQLADAAAAMLERFPDWRDPRVAQGWQNAVFQCLKPYGFSKAEASAITDVRLCDFLDHHLKLVDWADKVRNPKPVSKRPSKSTRDKSRSEPGPRDKHADRIAKAKAKGATPEDKIAGIVSLLAGNAPPK